MLAGKLRSCCVLLLENMYNRYVCYTCTFFQWLETEFIAYLDEWEGSANGREELTAAERQKLCISRETLEGLRFTGIHNYIYIYYIWIVFT